ncbi:MAG: MFS transporter [Alphaproteobacteria bacterium]|nr:MFS transporter [Alphaproteobacteria bacterium]
MSRPLWTIVLCAGTILGIVAGIRQGFGLFLLPMSADYGLSREAFAFSVGLQNLVWGFGAPFAGAVADRYGPRLVAFGGGLLYAAGTAVMAIDWGGAQMPASGALLGLGLSGAGFSVVLGAVGRAAPAEHRAKALALASFGGSIGMFSALPYTHLLIAGTGWIASLFVLAATSLLTVPLALGLGGRVEAARVAGAPRLGFRRSLVAATSERSFLLLTTGFFVCGFQLAFITVHLPPYLGDKGMAPWLGAAALTLVGIANIAGTLACGWLGQRYEKRIVLASLYLARAIMLAAFVALPLTETSVLLFAAGMGFTWLPTIPLTNGLVAQLFGPTYLSTLFGLVFLSHQLGGFVGPWVGGLVFDWTGSYDTVWWLSAALGLAAALLHWPIEERAVRPAVAASSA